MSESKYEQRVRHRATEFATEAYKRAFYSVQCGPPMPRTKFDQNNPFARKAIASLSENFMDAARLSIDREMEAYCWGYAVGKTTPTGNQVPTQNELQSLGLVPPTAPATDTGNK